MTLSIGPATDYLVTKATAAVVGITVNSGPVLVVDGWPDELAFGMFVVGLSQPPPEGAGESGGTRSWAGLGAQRLEEDYTIPCYIDLRTGGDSQKEVRDLSASIFDAFWALVKADLTLGGALKGGRYAEIVDLTVIPTNVGTAAEKGRRQVLYFGVHCRSLTT